MNPIKRIGRYEIPILNVATVTQVIRWRALFLHPIWRGFFERAIWRGFFLPRYKAVMTNGQTILFTEEEKIQLDKERRKHADVLHVWGMCKSAGLRA